MMQNTLIIMLLITTFIFIQLNHPLAMGLMLLIHTFLMCLIVSFFNETYWFSYILFLVFMGGLLVLFIYVTSLVSNETFSLSINYLMLTISFFLIIQFTLLFYDNLVTNNYFYTNIENINKENFQNLIKLFNYPTNWVTILLMNYLLITLIAVVKITNIFYGPLRQMFN